MPWLQVSFKTNAEQAQTLVEALEAVGASAITLGDDGDVPVFDNATGAQTLWEHTEVAGLFDIETDLQHLLSIVSQRSGLVTLPSHQTTILEDQDWARAWMDNFKPMCFGERLWVYPSWEQPPCPQAINLVLDPGQAFGVGSHPTTALCLNWLTTSKRIAGAEVVDYGCGSGILAIAAAKLGAAHVWAIDNDPRALEVTNGNVSKNEVSHRITVADAVATQLSHADIILANILSQTLISLAPRLAALVRPGGDLVLSGILKEQVEQCLTGYRPWFDIRDPANSGEWVCLHGVRKAD